MAFPKVNTTNGMRTDAAEASPILRPMKMMTTRNSQAEIRDKNKVKDLALEWLEGKEYFLVDATVDEQNKITVEIDHKDGVWIDDCCELSRFIEDHLDRDVEDFELEVGSAGIGQPFKVLQQYINSIGYDVELLTADGKKMEGALKSADEKGFVVTVIEKQKIEGKKRPQMVEVDKAFGYGDVKWVKNIIDFK